MVCSRAVRGREAIRAWAPALAATVALGAVGCGDSGSDATGSRGVFTVAVPKAVFPARQGVSRAAEMRIDVRNAGEKDIGNIAVTIEAKGQGTSAPPFTRRNDQPGLAEPFSTVWVVDRGPLSGDTSYSNTWALGKLTSGETKSFVWRVTPVVPGRHVVTYRIAPGLGNQGTARLEGGGRPAGTFAVNVSGAAPKQIVDPESGKVLPAPAGG